jgi:uncharacterized protein YkwD
MNMFRFSPSSHARAYVVPVAVTLLFAPTHADASELAEAVIAIVNKERVQRKLPPFKLDLRLVEASEVHAVDMADRQKLTHKFEIDVGTRANRSGFRYRYIGENVAVGFNSPEAVVKGWMNSPGHRRNILDRAFTHVGVGAAICDRGRVYWTQVFGAELPKRRGGQ